jgi:hypothetical protein
VQTNVHRIPNQPHDSCPYSLTSLQM